VPELESKYSSFRAKTNLPLRATRSGNISSKAATISNKLPDLGKDTSKLDLPTSSLALAKKRTVIGTVESAINPKKKYLKGFHVSLMNSTRDVSLVLLWQFVNKTLEFLLARFTNARAVR
jgi:hypothetical protein